MSIWRVSGICLHTFVTWYWSVYCSFYWEMISLTDEFKICRDKLLEMHRWDRCAEPASQRLCINLTCSFWAGACQVTPYVVVLLWCYSSSLVKKWLSDVLLFLWQPRFHQSGSSGGCLAVSVCARPLIRLHAAQTCAVLKLERFEDNRSADGDVRQAADRVASWIGSLKSRTGVITLIKVHIR